MLMEPGKDFCVRCRDEESTIAFLREMFLQYPDKVKFWNEDENKWDETRYDHIDYFPHLQYSSSLLTWDDETYAEEHGYVIVDYYDIPGARPLKDLGEIERHDADLSALFI